MGKILSHYVFICISLGVTDFQQFSFFSYIFWVFLCPIIPREKREPVCFAVNVFRKAIEAEKKLSIGDRYRVRNPEQTLD